MINNPKDLYNKEIKIQFNDIMDKFINSEHFKKIHSFYKAEIEENNNENIDGSNNKAFVSFYNDLKNEISNVKDFMEDFMVADNDEKKWNQC